MKWRAWDPKNGRHRSQVQNHKMRAALAGGSVSVGARGGLHPAAHRLAMRILTLVLKAPLCHVCGVIKVRKQRLKTSPHPFSLVPLELESLLNPKGLYLRFPPNPLATKSVERGTTSSPAK